MIEAHNKFRLTTGKEFYAYGNMLSISPEGELMYGYDGMVEWPDGEPFTADERKQVAQHMIRRWERWAEGA